MHLKMAKRKLNEKQERDVALLRICGVNLHNIEEEYGIAKSTVEHNIIKDRSYRWDDPLLRYYRTTLKRDRLRNSAHLYLAFHGINVPQEKLIDKERDKDIYHGVERHVYLPKISNIIRSISLDNFLEPTNEFERLISVIFGDSMSSKSIVEHFLVERLNGEYQKTSGFSLNNVFNDTEKSLIKRIKYGGLAITPNKAELIYDIMKKLSSRESYVIQESFGLRDKRSKTLEEIGHELKITAERVRQIKEEALSKLYNLREGYKIFYFFTDLATDSEISDYFRNIIHDEEKSHVIHKTKNILDRSIDTLGLNKRALRCLKNSGIRIIRDLTEKTDEELLSIRTLGRKTFNDIINIFEDNGLSLKEH